MLSRPMLRRSLRRTQYLDAASLLGQSAHASVLYDKARAGQAEGQPRPMLYDLHAQALSTSHGA